MSEVFTTGEVAKICKVAPRTVSKWFDSGQLSGYRIPGSQDRRIPRENLIQFMKKFGLPLGDLEEKANGLVVSTDQDLATALSEKINYKFKCQVEHASTAFSTGRFLAIRIFRFVVLDFSIGREHALEVAQYARTLKVYLVKAPSLAEDERALFADVFANLDADEIVGRIVKDMTNTG